MARARDQIRKGLNNRSQWGCHCLLFWCERCDEAENVPRSLTYRQLLIYSSVAHLPCHPPHMTRFGKGKEQEKRELSHRGLVWLLLKLDSGNIFLDRETEWKWTNWGKGSLTPPQLVTTLKQLTVMCAEMKATKIQEGATGHWLQCWGRKREGRGGGGGKKQTRVITANRVIALWCVSDNNIFLSFMTFSEHMTAEDYICQEGRGFEKDMLI